MSLIHADNFNIYGTNPAFMLNGRYSQVASASIVADPDGISIPKVIRFNEGTMRRPLQTPTSKVGIGMRIWMASLPSNDLMRPTPFMYRDSTNVFMVFVKINTTGSITAYVWDTSDGLAYELGTTVGPVVSADAWWHLEAALDASALTFELRVEGVVVLSADSTDFDGHLHNGPDIYQFSADTSLDNLGFGISTYFKDYFVWDGLGSHNNDFLGSCIVTDLAPDADIDIGGWVPSTGTTAWDILDNQTPATSPNVEAGFPVPDPMSMTLTDLPANVTSVKGMVTLVRAAKVDGGDGQLQVSTISGASEGAGVDRPITAAQTYWEDISELDPATSNSWTPVAVNAMGLKVDRTL